MRSQEKNDLSTLFMINNEISRLSKKHNWPYRFRVDCGSFETRIDIDSDGELQKGNGQFPQSGYEMFCPDLLDFNTLTIVEYEEEATPNTGFMRSKKAGHKGHFPEQLNPRDLKRDWYYQKAKFAMLKIWEHTIHDGTWKAVLYEFLLNVTPDKRGV